METFGEDQKLIMKVLGRLPSRYTASHTPPPDINNDIQEPFFDTTQYGDQILQSDVLNGQYIDLYKDTTYLNVRTRISEESKPISKLRSAVKMTTHRDNIDFSHVATEQMQESKNNSKRRNSSMGLNAVQITIDYMKTLSKEELRLLYVAYYFDFSLFDYSSTRVV